MMVVNSACSSLHWFDSRTVSLNSRTAHQTLIDVGLCGEQYRTRRRGTVRRPRPTALLFTYDLTAFTPPFRPPVEQLELVLIGRLKVVPFVERTLRT